MTLQEIRNKMNQIKSNISRKEGERSVVLGDLKKEFGIENIDAAFDLFDSLKEQSESKRAEREALIKEIEQKLAQYEQ